MTTEPSAASRWRSRIRAFAIAIAFVAAFAIAWVGFWRVRVMADALRGEREPCTEYRFVFELFGLQAMPDRSLRLTMDFSYSAMPDLYVDRAVLDNQGAMIAEFDPDWFIEPSPTRPILKDPTAATPDWIRIENRDGPALRALLDRGLYPTSILAYASLPDLAVRPMRVRLVESKLRGGITLQHGQPLAIGAMLGLLSLGVIALAKRLANRWTARTRAA